MDPLTGPLTDASTCRDAPRPLDPAAAVENDLVVEVHAGADVVRDDGDDLADLRPARAAAHVHVAVLFGEPVDLGLRVLHDEPVAGTAFREVARQRLRAGVGDGARPLTTVARIRSAQSSSGTLPSAMHDLSP